MTQMATALAIRDLSFSYGPNPILRNISLDLEAGRVTALLGANGAGKSTLLKILSGVIPHGDYDGSLAWAPLPPGEGTLRFESPREAQAAGVVTIPQDASLFPDLSVAENLALEGSGSPGTLPRSALYAEAKAILDRFESDLPLEASLASLPLAQRQGVSILRALARGGRVLLLDEPTAALPRNDAGKLLDLVRRAASEGRVVVYVSHHLEEVLKAADRVLVLRNGELALDRAAAGAKTRDLIGAMLGENPGPGRGGAPAPSLSPSLPSPPRGEGDIPVWVLKEFSFFSSGRASPKINLEIRKGEILGLSGLAGSGKDDLIPALLGAAPSSGILELDGKPVAARTPAALLRLGLVLVPGDRAGDGIFPDLSVGSHFLGQVEARLPFFSPLPKAKTMMKAEELRGRFKVQVPSLFDPIGSLSGGNQQKVLMARASAAGAKILLLDGPTRGVDVGARADIYRWVRAMTGEGLSCVMASDDLDELALLCDRVLCFKNREVTAELRGEGLSAAGLAGNL